MAARPARAGEFERAGWHRPMTFIPRQPSQSTVTKAQCPDQRSEGSLGVRYGGGRGGLRGARVATPHVSVRALAPGASALFHLCPFNCAYLQIFE
jgi:hypothetical protein